ncbi:MAG: hypothetical protein IKZ52_01145 [Bacteroidales bacterium]|nr:hypothetical protein [Bacteroidales bacterium]
MRVLQQMASMAEKNWISENMKEITLRVSDESLLPMLRKLFRSMDGVEVVTRRRKKSGLEKALEDVAAGRVYVAADGDDLIRQCLED